MGEQDAWDGIKLHCHNLGGMGPWILDSPAECGASNCKSVSKRLGWLTEFAEGS